MPILANFLLSLFTGLATWVAKYLTQKIAVAVALITIVTALFVGLYASLNALIGAGLNAVASFHPMFGVGVAMVISPHSASLISSYVTFWSLVELYKWKVNIISIWTRTI